MKKISKKQRGETFNSVFGDEEASDILSDLLNRTGREYTDQQLDAIGEAFEGLRAALDAGLN